MGPIFVAQGWGPNFPISKYSQNSQAVKNFLLSHLRSNRMERVTIFIDGSNFYHGLKENVGYANIDFEVFCDMLCGSRLLGRIYYYNTPVIREDDEVRYRDQQRFFDKLRKVPYLEIKYGRMQKKRNTATGAQVTVEKGVDVHIAVDMLYYAHNNAFDTAILISGDGDLVPAVNAVKHFGKHVENAYFEIGKSYHLGKAADKFMLLTKEIIDRCRLK